VSQRKDDQLCMMGDLVQLRGASLRVTLPCKVGEMS
jgi:hypothetical protein